MNTTKSVSLYFKEGGSDKEYHIQIVQSGDGYVVNFQYGRVGQALQSGSKTSTPVPLAQAEKIYDKLYKEKTGKGYQEKGEAKNNFTSGNGEKKKEVIISPQLLNDIDESELERYINDASWMAEPKFDGQRRIVICNGNIVGLNKKGTEVSLPDNLITQLKGFSCTIDCEIIGDNLFVFDILSKGGQDLRDVACRERYAILNGMNLKYCFDIHISPAAFTPSEKRRMLKDLKDTNGEGIIFKNKLAPYRSGRPASYGDQVKFKFYKTATFIVGKNPTGKGSVELFLMDKGKEVYMGKVTVAGKQSIPRPGDFVEVRYLYAYRGGCIFQPVYLGIRTDCDITDAGINQIVYKQEVEEVE